MTFVTMFVRNNFTRDSRVLREAKALAQAGLRVRVVALLDGDTVPEETVEGIEVVRVPGPAYAASVRRSLRADRTDGEEPASHRRASGRRLRAFARTALMPAHRAFAIADFHRKAYRVVEREPADVYHAHDLNTLPVAAKAARRRGVPLVYDSHELYPDVNGIGLLERWLARRVERRLIGQASAVVTVCPSIAEELVKRYGVPSPVVVRNIPDMPPRITRTDLLRKATGIPADEPVILYQGGFAPARGLETLVDAMVEVARGRLVLMGWGEFEHVLRRRIADRHLEGRVHIVPGVAQAALSDWTASADVGVVPYQATGLNNYYTCPNKLFEYIAAGVPVACSAYPELARIVIGYGLGATFDPRDPSSIARTLDLLLGPEANARCRDAAVGAQRELNWEREKLKLLQIYRRLTDGPPLALPPERSLPVPSGTLPFRA